MNAQDNVGICQWQDKGDNMKIRNSLIVFFVIMYILLPTTCLGAEITSDKQTNLAPDEDYNPPIYDEDDGEEPTEDTDIDKYGGIPWFATIQFKTAVITTIVITIGAFTFIFINNKKKKKKSTDPESDSFYEE